MTKFSAGDKIKVRLVGGSWPKESDDTAYSNIRGDGFYRGGVFDAVVGEEYPTGRQVLLGNRWWGVITDDERLGRMYGVEYVPEFAVGEHVRVVADHRNGQPYTHTPIGAVVKVVEIPFPGVYTTYRESHAPGDTWTYMVEELEKIELPTEEPLAEWELELMGQLPETVTIQAGNRISRDHPSIGKTESKENNVTEYNLGDHVIIGDDQNHPGYMPQLAGEAATIHSILSQPFGDYKYVLLIGDTVRHDLVFAGHELSPYTGPDDEPQGAVKPVDPVEPEPTEALIPAGTYVRVTGTAPSHLVGLIGTVSPFTEGSYDYHVRVTDQSGCNTELNRLGSVIAFRKDELEEYPEAANVPEEAAQEPEPEVEHKFQVGDRVKMSCYQTEERYGTVEKRGHSEDYYYKVQEDNVGFALGYNEDELELIVPKTRTLKTLLGISVGDLVFIKGGNTYGGTGRVVRIDPNAAFPFAVSKIQSPWRVIGEATEYVFGSDELEVLPEEPIETLDEVTMKKIIREQVISAAAQLGAVPVEAMSRVTDAMEDIDKILDARYNQGVKDGLDISADRVATLADHTREIALSMNREAEAALAA